MKRYWLSVAILFFIQFAQTVPVYAEILITNIDDIEISTSSLLARDLVITERFCIASNPVGPYAITAAGSGNDGAFSIQSGPYSIQYALTYRDRRSGGFRELQPGTTTAGFQSRRLNQNGRCPSDTGRLRLTIPRDQLNSAVAGRYQGFLQLVVVPE